VARIVARSSGITRSKKPNTRSDPSDVVISWADPADISRIRSLAQYERRYQMMLRLYGAMAVAITLATWVVCFQENPPGAAVPDSQAARVVGGQENHPYKGNGSQNFCTGSTYDGCGGGSCSTTLVAQTLAGQGTRDYQNNQPCSKTLCQGGGSASCGSVTITVCN